jgi:flagellar protein FliS
MDALNVYKYAQATTSSPAELVVMLYRGAIRFTVNSIAAIEEGNHERAHHGLVRAQAIVAELNLTLDHEHGGNIARQLASIYAFVNRRLIEANVRKDTRPAAEVLVLLRELLAAWEQASHQIQPVQHVRGLALAA